MIAIANPDTRGRTVSKSRSGLVIAVALAGVLAGVAAAGAGSLPMQWNAPTTNADGSPLSDLASYRIYLGTTAPSCPGASFHTVSSSTSTPTTGEVVASRIVGLSAGITYFARVTAIDASGNESGCSASASGAAQADVSVMPASTTSFGTIAVGSTVDRSFTVQNTGTASIAGTARVGAPFTIQSGASFSLAPGATRTVTVRFAPATAGSFAANVNLAAGGDVVSRAVSGSATAAAVTLSVVKSGTGTGTVTSVPAGISCGSDCSASVASGTQLGLAATSAPGSTFAGWSGACSGTGACTVTVHAASAVTATFVLAPVTLSVTRTGSGSGTVTSGPAGITCGSDCNETVAPGTLLTLTATPARNSVFAGWSGACVGTAATCTWTLNATTVVTATFDTARVERSSKPVPVPVVGYLSPSSVSAGTAGVTLTVNGNNFVETSVVHWHGVPRPTTYVNKKRLRVTITSADLATPGSVPVTVVTLAPGGGTSGAATFTVTAAPHALIRSPATTTSSALAVEPARHLVVDATGLSGWAPGLAGPAAADARLSRRGGAGRRGRSRG